MAVIREEKVRLINSVRRYHSIEIEPGLVTPGRVPLSYLQDMLRYLQFPESLEGLTVPDAGAWDGSFSFEAERRGVRWVVALGLHPPDRYGSAVVKSLLNSRVEYVQSTVYEISPEPSVRSTWSCFSACSITCGIPCWPWTASGASPASTCSWRPTL
jgi:tRNA (mo5U34)-methyltransferase